MAQVLGLHGIAQQQKGRAQLVEEWGPGLADGVESAAGVSAAVPSLDLCFYGDLFLPAAAQGQRQPPGKGQMAKADELAVPVSGDDAAFLDEAASEVESALPDLGPAMGAPKVPGVLQPVLKRLTRRMDGGLALQFLRVLRQVKAYLDDEEMAARIRELFIAKLDAGPSVVVAHSLGTVIAVDTLRLHRDRGASVLVTLGSPLGMLAVQSRLRQPEPPTDPAQGVMNVSRWVNVYDPADPVAAAGGLSRIWPMVDDYTVVNGKDPHAIRPYLGKQVTGQAVLDGLP